jgi:pyridoxal phosphate enzyme (YggS family)
MSLAENLQRVRERIATAAERAGRDPAGVSLVAVSKTHPPAAVEGAVALGQLIFGENKVQEARAKIPECSGRARWHLIGHLQTNKAKLAAQIFDLIESVDSLALARELSERAGQFDRTLPVLWQVNVAGESAKFGYAPERLLAELDELAALPHLRPEGLMTIAPFVTDAEKVRPVFRRLRELKDACEQRLGVALPHLSMGMSGDFEAAIAEGATLVRIGTAIFGARPRLAARNPEAVDGGM